MDSRSTLRYPVNLEATIQLGGSELSCRVRNVSLGGVFIRGPSLPIGTRVVLRFGGANLPDIEVACTTRWYTDEGSGLQFESLCAVDTYTLAKFIRASSRLTGKIPTDAVLRQV